MTKDRLMLGLAFMLPLLMSAGAFVDGTLWVTGSMNYFWIAPLGLIGLYPLVYCLTKKKILRWPITLIGLLFAGIAASSQEQVGAILVGLSIAAFVYSMIIHSIKNNLRLAVYPLPFLVVTIIFLMINISAPGNELRVQSETLQWLPQLPITPLIDRLNYSVRWVIDSIVNQTTFLFGLSTVLLAILFIKKRSKDKFDYVFMVVLPILALLLFSKGIESIRYWFNFFPTWADPGISKISYIPLVFWTLATLFIAISPLFLFRKKSTGTLLSILYGSFIAGISMLTLSPTMYASGFRVLYIPSLVLCFICYFLFEKVFEKHPKAFLLTFGMTVLFFASQYLLIMLKVIN